MHRAHQKSLATAPTSEKAARVPFGCLDLCALWDVCAALQVAVAGSSTPLCCPSGPLTVFTGLLFDVSKKLELEFLPFYAWTGIWLGIAAECIALLSPGMASVSIFVSDWAGWHPGVVRLIKNQTGGTLLQPPPPPPCPPLQTKVTIVGKHEIYDWDNLVGPLLGHKLLRSSPPHPPAQKTSWSALCTCTQLRPEHGRCELGRLHFGRIAGHFEYLFLKGPSGSPENRPV